MWNIDAVEIRDAKKNSLPFSRAVTYGPFVFISGTTSMDLYTGKPILTDLKQETENIIKNIEIILKQVGGSLDDVIKTTVFITDDKYFSDMNEVYKKHFNNRLPARSTVVIGLAGGYKIEIEAIAALKNQV